MLKLTGQDIPQPLQTIPTPPKQLFVLGNLAELLQRPCLAIVGSRKLTDYGRAVTRQLASELAGQGVVIVSGLAFGVDSVAHQAALEAGGLTLAVLPSPVETVYPASHRQLAKRILDQGGALISEYPAGTESYKGNFVARNRLVAGISRATLITEAALKSGSLHTARFALEAGRDVLAVPGNITSPTSVGTNNLIRAGATPVTNSDDVLYALGITPQAKSLTRPKGANPAEQVILDLIYNGTNDGDELQLKSELDITEFNQNLTMLEITGKIRSSGANHWTLA